MKWNGIVEKMKNGNGMGWEKWVIQTYGRAKRPVKPRRTEQQQQQTNRYCIVIPSNIH